MINIILSKINTLYDLKIYYYDKIIYKEKYLINVLGWYKKHFSDSITIILYNEELEEIEIVSYKHSEILNYYIRDDKLIVYDNEGLTKFEIITEDIDVL